MKLFNKFIDKDLLSVGEGKNKLSVFSLALPIFFESIGVHLIGLVQSAMSAHYEGGFFVTVTAIPSTILSLFLNVIAMITTGMSIILSITLGRGQNSNCKKIIGNAFIVICILNVTLCLAGFFLSPQLLSLMGMKGKDYAEKIPYATTYLRWRFLLTIIFNVSPIFTSALRCYGYTKVGFICSISSNIVNAGLTAVAMYALKLNFTQMIYALIIICAASSLVNLLLAVVLFFRKKIGIEIKPDGGLCKAMIKVGLPASVSAIAYSLSQTITARFCVDITEDAYLAKTYISQLVFFVYQLGYSIGQANSIMVGRICGMGDLDRVDKMHRQNLRIVLTLNISFSVLLAILSKYLVSALFAANAKILEYSYVVLWIDIAVEIGRGMNHLGQFGLNATGDTVYTTVVSIVSCWVCSVFMSYLFIKLGWDLYGIWCAFAIDELFRGILYYVRWRKGGWRGRFTKEFETIENATKQ